MTRPVLILSIAVSAVILLVGASNPTPALTKFVDSLPIPKRIELKGTGPVDYTIPLTQFQTKIHRDLPPTTEWGYDGMSPGPTIEVESGQTVRIHWLNRLPSTHLFPSPKGADVISPDVRAVTHLHGAEVTEMDPTDRDHNNDGWPDTWTVNGQEQVAEYPNHQSARTLWYHDHAMGETGRNVAAGLLGLYEIHDSYERSLNLPSGKYEIPLAIQARAVNADGTLAYTNDIGNEFYGNAIAVNGKLWPYLEVEPRRYRFRIVNVSNARSYGLKLVDSANNSAGPAFSQIGSDGGFLATPVTLNDPSDLSAPRLVISPAERADVIVDFSEFAGRNLLLQNNSHDIGEIEQSLPEVMLFKVGTSVTTPDTSASTEELHALMKPIVRMNPSDASATRLFIFDQMVMPDGTAMLTINGSRWMDPITEKPVLGTTEVWELVNTLSDTHPFHIHGVDFQVLDRRLFDVKEYLATGKINYLAPAVLPAPNEMGWKDVIRTYPQMVTRIIMKFDPYPGYYVYHCHILEHEDMDMMRPFQIVPGL